MITTFNGLTQQVLRLLDATAGETETTTALVKDALNQAHLQRCTEFPWSFLIWAVEETFTTVPGQTIYPLHQEFHRPLYFRNRTATVELKEVPQRELLAVNEEIEGSARRFAFVERSPVKAHPANAVVTLVSSSAYDIGEDYQIAIKGVTAANDVEVEILTPNGTQIVEGVTQWRRILAVTKEREWSGSLSLRTGGVEILELDPTEMGRSYPQICLMETPTEAETIGYRFFRQPLMLVNDYDIPEIPAPHAQILVWDALVAMAGYLTELQPFRFGIWQGKQAEAQSALYQAFANESQSLGTPPTTVRLIEDGDAA